MNEMKDSHGGNPFPRAARHFTPKTPANAKGDNLKGNYGKNSRKARKPGTPCKGTAPSCGHIHKKGPRTWTPSARPLPQNKESEGKAVLKEFAKLVLCATLASILSLSWLYVVAKIDGGISGRPAVKEIAPNPSTEASSSQETPSFQEAPSSKEPLSKANPFRKIGDRLRLNARSGWPGT